MRPCVIRMNGIGLVLAAACLVHAGSAESEPPPYCEQAILRNWRTPLRELPYRGAYVSLIQRDTAGGAVCELWQNTWGDGGAAERGIIVRRGADLLRLGAEQEVCNGLLIDDVFLPDRPDTLAPLRGFTRPYMTWHDDIGYVLLACVCPDYRPGGVNLLPALLTSPDGAPGSWTYRGILRGDLAERAARQRVWSDGGALVRMADGSWRVYLNGVGTTVAMLQSATLEGPWRFLRNADETIRELLPDFPRERGRGGCFPTVLKVSDSEWHLWISDTWPPQAMFHYASADGIDWQPFGAQPELTRLGVGPSGIKCLRAALSRDGTRIIGLLSVWHRHPDGGGEWRLHTTQMPVGLTPAAD